MIKRLVLLATTIAMLAIPSAAQAIELAQPGIHIPDTYGGSGGYTTRGDEYVRWQPVDHTESGGIPHTVQIEEFFAPSGARASLRFVDGQLKTGTIFGPSPAWGIAYPDTLDRTPDRCALTEADDEIWKIQDTSNLPCARAKRALDHYLERDRAPRHFRCLLVDETRAKCWAKGHRTTQYAYAVETSTDELADQRAHRAHAVVLCGNTSPGAFYVYADGGSEATCGSIVNAAGRIAAGAFIYGTWTETVDGWTCTGIERRTECHSGSQCATIRRGSLGDKIDADERGEFRWTPTAVC